jgi:hypothetical protein
VRIAFDNVTHPLRVAKSLRKSLKDRGIYIPLSRCQETLARMTGHVDWHELANVAGAGGLGFIPDALAPLGTRAARQRQYHSELVSAGVPESKAHAVLAEAPPTGAKLPGPDVDAPFLLAAHPLLSGCDLSPKAVSAMPGFLNLMRRAHQAIAHEPFWSEKASWEVFGKVDPTAVALLNGMRRNLAHGWWGPAVALALLRHADACAESAVMRDEGHRSVSDFAVDGVEGMSTDLATCSQKEVAEGVRVLLQALGPCVLAAAAAGPAVGRDPLPEVRGDLNLALVVGRVYGIPLDNPLDSLGIPVWMHLGLDLLPNLHHDVEAEFDLMFGRHDRYEIRFVSGAYDPDLAAFSAKLGEPAGRQLLDEAGQAGWRTVLLGKRYPSGIRIVGAHPVSQALDLSAGLTRITCGTARWRRSAAVDHGKLLVAAVVEALMRQEGAWERLVPPGRSRLVEMVGTNPSADLADDLRHALRSVASRSADHSAAYLAIPAIADDFETLPTLVAFDVEPDAKAFLDRLALARRSVFHQGPGILALVPGSRGCKVLKEHDHPLEPFPWDPDLGTQAEVRSLIRAMGRKADLDEPALVLGPLGTAFLVEKEDLELMVEGICESMAVHVPGAASVRDRTLLLEFMSMTGTEGIF